MLASPAEVLPRGEGWAYEFKWDGIRALVDVSDRGVRVSSRRGNDITVAYPELVAQFDGLGNLLLDGEIVVFVDGAPSFQELQARMHVRRTADIRRLATQAPVTFVLFDLLRVEEEDLRSASYADRRQRLEALGAERGWTVSPSFADGPATEEAARRHGLEGVVAKKLASRYRGGIRSDDWRKLRFSRSGDFAVIAWEAPREDPDNLSSLTLARLGPSGALEFAGRVGSGLTGRLAGVLARRLSERATCPLETTPPAMSGRATHWVEPELVVEVKYTMVTSDGRLRQPVLLRVREDKTVDEVDG